MTTLPVALLHGSLADLPPWDAWHFDPSTVVGTLALAALYGWGVGPARRRLGGPRGFPFARAVSFFTGCAVLLVSLNGPLHELSDYYLLSAHMAQHLLLTLVVPLLWLAGLPGWLADALLSRWGLGRLARVVTTPLVAYALYNGFLLVWHLPPAYDLTLRVHAVHIAQHLGFLATGVLAWWPILSRSALLPPLSPGPAMLYLFLLTLPMKVIGAFVTLADHVLYDFYASAPRVLGLSAWQDQQLGGLLMWMPGGLIYWTAIAIIFYRWYDREEGLFGPRDRTSGATLRARSAYRAVDPATATATERMP